MKTYIIVNEVAKLLYHCMSPVTTATSVPAAYSSAIYPTASVSLLLSSLAPLCYMSTLLVD